MCGDPLAVSADVEKVAEPFTSAAAGVCAAPSMEKETVPVGLAVRPVSTAVTVAMKVTLASREEALLDAWRLIWLAALIKTRCRRSPGTGLTVGGGDKRGLLEMGASSGIVGS